MSELDLIKFFCFADVLFLFVHGDVNSAKVIKEALDDFKDASGIMRGRSSTVVETYLGVLWVKLKVAMGMLFVFDNKKVGLGVVGLVTSK
ncbi:hypothetical protein Tco_0864936 [Tanacetum coccineum]